MQGFQRYNREWAATSSINGERYVMVCTTPKCAEEGIWAPDGTFDPKTGMCLVGDWTGDIFCDGHAKERDI